MITPALHRQPVPLDPQQHRALKVAFPLTDWSLASGLNAIFVAVNEFAEACKEYPVVFVRTGGGGGGGGNGAARDEVAPIAVLGVTAGQNLFIDDAAAAGPGQAQAPRWRAHYKPAILQAYPFCIGRIDDQRFAVCVDLAWSGCRNEAGAASASTATSAASAASGDAQALFDAAGQPSEFLKTMRQHLELFEGAVQSTRAFCRRLVELDLLREMRFDATLPDGRKHTVDGFLTVDQERAQALPDATVGELHRNGMLGLVHVHWASLSLMRRLMDWHLQRLPAPPQ